MVQIEQQIAAMPVPASDARASFVLRFLAGEEAFRPVRPSQVLHSKETGRLKAAVAFALAAGLAAFALGWWAWPPAEPISNPSGARTLAQRPPDRQKQLRERLELARTPADKVKRLTDLVEELQEEARKSQTDAEKLDEVARFCVQVVRDHLLQHARTVPAAERKDVLTAVAARLERIESQASQLANEMKGRAVASAAASYSDIANATRETYLSLRRLARGEAA